MTEFKLDTTGQVALHIQTAPRIHEYARWDDLSPFMRGYIEAIFNDSKGLYWAGTKLGVPMVRGFRHLSPACLLQISGDCERFLTGDKGRVRNDRASGASFWRARQIGALATFYGFGPLTVYLDDDGKVRLR